MESERRSIWRNDEPCKVCGTMVCAHGKMPYHNLAHPSEDTLASWLESACEVTVGGRLTSSEAYMSYRTWLELLNILAPSHKAFSKLMMQRGFASKKSGTRYFEGLRLKPLPPSTWADPFD